jgi:predicted NBD/HSP70 family sugar kinase
MARRSRPASPQVLTNAPFDILVIDVGGTNVKLRATGQKKLVRIPSGASMSPRQMMAAIRREIARWRVQAVSVGLPGIVLHGRILHEPRNLGKGWVRFDFGKAFRLPVKVINDAAMQALGSYQGRRMLFLGLGTGLGSAFIVDGRLEALELHGRELGILTAHCMAFDPLC